ncbi:phage portal protein, lambda family, partial [Burkholderia pseudomallei 354a]
PVQDVTAKRMEIRAGLASRTGAVLARGDDPEQVDAENAADLAREQRLGLRYDTQLAIEDGNGSVLKEDGE